VEVPPKAAEVNENAPERRSSRASDYEFKTDSPDYNVGNEILLRDAEQDVFEPPHAAGDDRESVHADYDDESDYYESDIESIHEHEERLRDEQKGVPASHW
jgi:hypothetical protein